MAYSDDLTLIYTDSTGTERIERYSTASGYLKRVEELEDQGITVLS